MRTGRLLTRSFVLAFASHFLHALAFSLYLHLPGFLHELGAAEVQIGFIFGATGLTAVLVRPLLGRAIDARGRRVVILTGGVAHVVICLAYLTVTRLGPWLVAVRVVHGVAEAMLFAALFAVAADVVPAARRIQGIALFGVSGMLPMSLSGLLGDAIIAHSGYRTLFQTSVLFASVGLLFSLPLRDVVRKAGDLPSRGFFAAATQRDLLPLWGAGLCFATAIAAYFTFLKTYVIESGVGSVGLFFTFYSIAAIALRITLGSLPDRLGPTRVLVPAWLALAGGLILLSRASGNVGVAIAALLCGLGHGFTFPILLGLAVKRARPSERGTALALYTALFDAGTLVGSPLLGGVIRVAGYPAMFVCAAALVVAGGVGFVLSPKDNQARVT